MTQGPWPERDHAVDLEVELTDRQVEAAHVALATGWWDGPPRQARVADVADVLDVSGAAAGRLIREVESRVMREFVTQTEMTRAIRPGEAEVPQ